MNTLSSSSKRSSELAEALMQLTNAILSTQTGDKRMDEWMDERWAKEMNLGWNIVPEQYRSLDLLLCSSLRYQVS